MLTSTPLTGRNPQLGIATTNLYAEFKPHVITYREMYIKK